MHIVQQTVRKDSTVMDKFFRDIKFRHYAFNYIKYIIERSENKKRSERSEELKKIKDAISRKAHFEKLMRKENN